MTYYLWRYGEYIKRINSDGEVGIQFYVSKQTIAKIVYLLVRLYPTSVENAGGTSTTNVNISLTGSSYDIYVLEGEETNDVILPNQDYLGGFGKISLENILLSPDDKLQCWRTHIQQNSFVIFELKVLLNSYAKPTITYYGGAGNQRGSLYYDQIIGVE